MQVGTLDNNCWYCALVFYTIDKFAKKTLPDGKVFSNFQRFSRAQRPFARAISRHFSASYLFCFLDIRSAQQQPVYNRKHRRQREEKQNKAQGRRQNPVKHRGQVNVCLNKQIRDNIHQQRNWNRNDDGNSRLSRQNSKEKNIPPMQAQNTRLTFKIRLWICSKRLSVLALSPR